MSDTTIGLARVLDGLAAATEAGFDDIKLNAVVRRGVNDDGILDLARFGREHGYTVRFIEYMDVGTTNGWRMDEVVPAAEIIRRIDAELPLKPVEADYVGEVAQRWCYRDGAGEVGVVASVTQAFCSTCTRARLSPVGELYTCLFASAGTDLRALLRGGIDDDDLVAAISGRWAVRDDRYSQLRASATNRSGQGPRKVEMSYIGG